MKVTKPKGREVPECASPSLSLSSTVAFCTSHWKCHSLRGFLVPFPLSFSAICFYGTHVSAVVLLTKQIHLFSCLTARRQQPKERSVELKKASLRAAAARAEVSPCEHRHGSCCSQCLCLSEMEEISRGKWCPVSTRALFLSSAPQSTALWR